MKNIPMKRVYLLRGTVLSHLKYQKLLIWIDKFLEWVLQKLRYKQTVTLRNKLFRGYPWFGFVFDYTITIVAINCCKCFVYYISFLYYYTSITYIHMKINQYLNAKESITYV